MVNSFVRPVLYFTKALLIRTNSFPFPFPVQFQFIDWRNATKRLQQYDNRYCDKDCVIKLRQRAAKLERIDTKLTEQLEKEKCYWKEVLKRVVVAVIKALASRGLAFRGSDEGFGETNNGNYLMMS